MKTILAILMLVELIILVALLRYLHKKNSPKNPGFKVDLQKSIRGVKEAVSALK